MSQYNLIYLMGTGRSGTTALATILGNHEDILTLGEINQLYGEIAHKARLSNAWSKVYKSLKVEDYEIANKQIYNVERHYKALAYGLGVLTPSEHYHNYQNSMFDSIQEAMPKPYYVDSSKYVARALLLNKNDKVNLKIINLVRDPRGLIWSFNKKVQTRNNPIKTIVYYYAINSLALISARFFSKKKVITMKYEDMTADTDAFFGRIGKHLDIDLSSLCHKITAKKPFEVPDIVGGNRLKKSKEIRISPDLEWRKKMPRFLQLVYWLLTLPFNIIYKYKL